MMPKKKKVQLTPEGLKSLEKELKERKTKIRKELQDQLDTELDQGDVSENTSYYRIQEEIGSNDKRIDEIEEILENSEMIEKATCVGSECVVEVGHKVTVKVQDKELTYEIAGSTEADPSKNIISIDSPIGQALAGKKEGETVSIKTPIGTTKYDIIKVE